MTTIVYFNGVLAADTQVNSGNHCPSGTVEKIGRLEDHSLWAFSGGLQMQEACVAWATGDRRGSPPAMDDEGVFILVLPDGRVREWWGKGWIELQAEAYAWGSGERPARAAIMAGAGPERAVEIAAALDSDTGGKIMALSLNAASGDGTKAPRN